MSEQIDQLRRYANLIEPMLRPIEPFDPRAESDTAMQVERAAVFAAALIDPSAGDDPLRIDRLIALPRREQPLHTLAVVDHRGHHRPVYRPLLIYSWLQTFSLAYEVLERGRFGQWEEATRTWSDLLEAELGVIQWPGDAIPAARGGIAAEAAWMALALHVAGKLFFRDAWTDLASDTFGRLMRSQRPDGAFLHTTSADNPETHGYHELAVLHAAASYAVQVEDRPLAAAVQRSTMFHMEQTQPDHATNQPWGLFAFIWNPPTRSLADQLLHAAAVQQTESLGLSQMLLADVLLCLRLFLPK